MTGQIPEPSEIKPLADKLNLALAKLNEALLGREQLHKLLMAAMIARGHVLLEGLPGLGKTALVTCLGKLLSLKFKRVQFTPDLLPGDILGAHILQETESGRREMIFQPGPVFTNILLGDEINRASPKTQSALLEAMQEKTVTLMGDTKKLPSPFFVLATQNPIELEGTYPLPEAQLDRFLFKLEVGSPDVESIEKIILERHRGELPEFSPLITEQDFAEIYSVIDRMKIPQAVASYIARIVKAASPDSGMDKVSCYIRYGASPRAAIAIAEAAKALALIDGRPTVGFSDVEAVAPWALHHRITLDYRAKSERIKPLDLAREIISKISPSANRIPDGIMRG